MGFNVLQLCHEAIDRLNSCEEMLEAVSSTNGEASNKEPNKLSDDTLFKLTIVAIMCTQQLQNKGIFSTLRFTKCKTLFLF